jgi:murein DD-endopeptidase MepM/ murein hydrolase activator NlpD
MRRIFLENIVAVLLLALTVACTQSPAQVDLKGQNTYGRNGANYNSSSSYNSSSVVNTATTQSAAVQSIGVSDLSPPGSNAPAKTASNAPSNAPFKYAKLSPAAGGSPVNPWTKQPREQSSNTQAVNTLDGVVSNDSSAKPTTVAITKPVKTEVAAGAFMWPVASKKILSEFGPKGSGKVNDGINIASSDGEPVWAAADGEVVYVGNELQGYGNMVLIKHDGDKAATYAHLSKATVEKYDRVKQGDIIGYVGSTGNVKEPQLHFALRDGKDSVDPLKYLDRKVASLP